MATDWIASVLEAVKSQNRSLLQIVPEQQKRDADGRSASLWVDWEGQNGWRIKCYDLYFDRFYGLRDLPPEVQIRNQFLMTEDTFYRLCLRKLDPAEARMEGLIQVGGGHSLYDGLEIEKIWGDIVDKLISPIINGAMVASEGGTEC